VGEQEISGFLGLLMDSARLSGPQVHDWKRQCSNSGAIARPTSPSTGSEVTQNLHALVYQLRRRLAALEPGGGARLARAGAG
jgi:hypothetical protein